jgi:hypothetical protein
MTSLELWRYHSISFPFRLSVVLRKGRRHLVLNVVSMDVWYDILLLVRNSCKDEAQKADALSQCRKQSHKLYFSPKWDSQHVNNFMGIICLVLSTSSFTRCTFSSVLLVDDVLNVQHLLHRSHNLWTRENHSKTCVLPAVCSPKATLNTLKIHINLKDILFFEVFSSLQFSRYAKIANRTTYTSITQQSYILWPYPKHWHSTIYSIRSHGQPRNHLNATCTLKTGRFSLFWGHRVFKMNIAIL